MSGPVERTVESTIAGSGPTIDHALADAYDSTAREMFTLDKVSGYTLTLTVTAISISGGADRHDYGSLAPVVTVECATRAVLTLR